MGNVLPVDEAIKLVDLEPYASVFPTHDLTEVRQGLIGRVEADRWEGTCQSVPGP